MTEQSELEIRPVTRERWADMVDLFARPGPRGGRTPSSDCWCVFWRTDRRTFEEGTGRGATRGRGNRAAMQRIVAEGREPGLLAYLDGRPVGWVSVAPRSEFPRIEQSRSLRPVDDRPVWSIVCFYIHRAHQRSGIGAALLRAAVEHAAARGATTLEAYGSRPSDSDPFTGLESMFLAAGFAKVRQGGRRSILRRELGGASRG